MAQEVMSSSTLILFLLSLSPVYSTSGSKSTPKYLAKSCTNDTVLAENSNYQNNLDTLLHSLSSHVTSSRTGFFSSSAGTSDAAYGLFLCRGDQNATSCSNCVTVATATDLEKMCPGAKSGIIWYDECMVRYSDTPVSGKLSIDPTESVWSQKGIGTDTLPFVSALEALLDEAKGKAAEDESGRKFASGTETWEGVGKLYGLVQCTPDLTPGDCGTCLTSAIGTIPFAVAGSALKPSCFVQYANYPFFNAPAHSPNLGKKGRLGKVVIAIIVSTIAVVVALLAVGVYSIKKKRAKEYNSFAIATDDLETAKSLQFRFDTLKQATNNFSNDNKLGEGGFGIVYKGVLKNGQEIAVKRLSGSSTQGVKEFRNEIVLVAKLRHKNLVRLLGFCLAGKEKLLVYEFVPNKSLNYFVFGFERQGELDWKKRYQIIRGIAQGMCYLHHDSQIRIIHRDLKASNVLLDADMNAKISDFGMARIFDIDGQGNTSRIVGTYGYMAPEYALRGQFSIKSDVYSFGVLLLEIISGRRNTTFSVTEHEQDFLGYAWKLWEEEKPLEFVDPTIRNSCSIAEVMKCLQIGLLCVQYSVNKRPTMGVVVRKLDVYSENPDMPEKPAFFMRGIERMSSSHDSMSEQSITKSMSYSVNNISISEAEPR